MFKSPVSPVPFSFNLAVIHLACWPQFSYPVHSTFALLLSLATFTSFCFSQPMLAEPFHIWMHTRRKQFMALVYCLQTMIAHVTFITQSFLPTVFTSCNCLFVLREADMDRPVLPHSKYILSYASKAQEQRTPQRKAPMYVSFLNSQAIYTSILSL